MTENKVRPGTAAGVQEVRPDDNSEIEKTMRGEARAWSHPHGGPEAWKAELCPWERGGHDGWHAGENATKAVARPGSVSGKSKQRRSGRLKVSVPILIMGSDDEGKLFSEETHTVVLSLHGAGIVSRHRMVAEQELTLRLLKTNREAEVRVVGEIASEGQMHTYGVAFVDDQLDFWKMEFPPAAIWRPDLLVLECGVCKGTVELLNGDYEYDICAIHGGLPRYCDSCGFLTVWKQSQESGPLATREAKGEEKPAGRRAEVAVVEEKKEEVVTLAEAMESAERRYRARVKVNFSACVRTREFGDDVVVCIDMSRGGVSFRSRNLYKRDTQVMIAVPFSQEAKDAPAIFVKGRIANVTGMEGQSMWRCGVEFLRG